MILTHPKILGEFELEEAFTGTEKEAATPTYGA
jgi:hypothetical protein